MFLAINEIKHSLFRYFLVTGVMFLIAYLVFFLTGLAYGLAEDNRTAIDKWEADHIILSKDSNENLNMSMIPPENFEQIKSTDKAQLRQTPNIISKSGNSETINVAFFGINSSEFLTPNIIEGHLFKEKNEAVLDQSLKELNDVNIGDTLKLSGSTAKIKVVGFTDDAKYNISPVIFVSMDTFKTVKFKNDNSLKNVNLPLNAIVTRGKPQDVPSTLKTIPIKTYIQNLPGYNAQVLTFGFMIGFLILIAAIVIGIFIYVLTMQKIDILGVMKAQGVSNHYISFSIICQTFILSITGVGTGMLLTFLTSLVLPKKVPFAINPSFYLVIGFLMVIFALIGALSSVKSIVKIDPLEAIG
ncbi:ABC transporter permease [Vagococcus carniphilus]|uniref:ABC transporter permease n=1 Tax=Vagococcus carniphilus TaxID=218144 RepID=UPI002890FDC3|nr:ABC transporter permease [Vagococcus carniphilus]MDT2831952.1 ABC transporter permease [Vagococcus carniphilus]MDT2840798.1 ABC transporter permease [Vagococcus carniphilus]MDT2849657.1 ABC transporter permease [Vagococcus carniphilus]MDT2855462.1 ABC transporter permease [Vagococcus carniphilus]